LADQFSLRILSTIVSRLRSDDAGLRAFSGVVFRVRNAVLSQGQAMAPQIVELTHTTQSSHSGNEGKIYF
jgi:hypothetical protein